MMSKGSLPPTPPPASVDGDGGTTGAAKAGGGGVRQCSPRATPADRPHPPTQSVSPPSRGQRPTHPPSTKRPAAATAAFGSLPVAGGGQEEARLPGGPPSGRPGGGWASPPPPPPPHVVGRPRRLRPRRLRQAAGSTVLERWDGGSRGWGTHAAQRAVAGRRGGGRGWDG